MGQKTPQKRVFERILVHFVTCFEQLRLALVTLKTLVYMFVFGWLERGAFFELRVAFLFFFEMSIFFYTFIYYKISITKKKR